MVKLLHILKEQYDYIILDNAPVGLVTDGQICGKHSDLNIFILRHGISKKDQIGFINQLAETKNMSNLALIVNDIQGRGFGYGNKYYYYNYNYKYYDYGGYYEENHKPVKKVLRWIKKFL
jgi:Mrp family chromosome partitioning ATPase